MKLKTIILVIVITSFLFGCKKVNRYTDKHGNKFIEKGEETYIIPAEYVKTGELYKTFLLNQTNKSVNIKNKFTLGPGDERIFKFSDTDSMIFNIGPKIYFGDFGLEIEDRRSQLAGIGGEYWKKYNVPDDVEYGFVIVEPDKGDAPTR